MALYMLYTFGVKTLSTLTLTMNPFEEVCCFSVCDISCYQVQSDVDIIPAGSQKKYQKGAHWGLKMVSNDVFWRFKV